MYDLTKYYGEIPDDKVIFWDGFLYIFRPKDRNDQMEREFLVECRCLNAKYDEPITLADITDATMVFYETALHGEIYRKGNHEKGRWEKIGTTVGYA